MKILSRHGVKRLTVALISVCLLTLVILLGLRWRTHISYADRTFKNAAGVPVESEPRIAIVFGAGLWTHKRPSPILYDRVAVAAELYHAGRVRKLLLTGDNRFDNYNEPAAMRQTALEMGVPDQDLVLDYAGRRTYDSCYRAREIFGVRRATLVTQEFHLDRALYLCNSLGVDSIGVAADRQAYGGSRLWWSTRELGALATAWLDIHLLHPTPILGEKIQIDQKAEGKRSWQMFEAQLSE